MTAPNFGNLKKADVDPRRQRPFTFDELEGAPCLLVRFVGEKNTRLFQAIQRRGAKGRSAMSPAQLIKKGRRNARELFAGDDGCIDGWPTPPIDMDGNRVEWSVENCTAFLHALPDHLIARLVDFVTEHENFIVGDELSEDDVAAMAGNSEGGSSGS